MTMMVLPFIRLSSLLRTKKRPVILPLKVVFQRNRHSFHPIIRIISSFVLLFQLFIFIQASFVYNSYHHYHPPITTISDNNNKLFLRSFSQPKIHTNSLIINPTSPTTAKVPAFQQRQHRQRIGRYPIQLLAFIDKHTFDINNRIKYLERKKKTGTNHPRNNKNNSSNKVLTVLSSSTSSTSSTTEEDFTMNNNNNVNDEENSSIKRQRIDNDITMNDNDKTKKNKKNDDDIDNDKWKHISEKMEQRANGMNERTKLQKPFTEMEWNDLKQSIDNIMLMNNNNDNNNNEEEEIIKEKINIDYETLYQFIQNVGHLSHKDWSRTGNNGLKFGQILFPLQNLSSLSSSTSSLMIHNMLHRILNDGNWYNAIQYATNITNNKSDNNEGNTHCPWAVLVTGVNGIRKTTSIYQSWFPKLLSEALIVPIHMNDIDDDYNESINSTMYDLPIGSNSFFRQLDHMITTLCNVDFKILYQYAYELIQCEQNQHDHDNDHDNDNKNVMIPSKEIVQQYSNLKAAIFTRYRTLSELLGAYLLYEAQKYNMNCMLETSGRDVAMFHYIDHFFSSDDSSKYRKLALHFTINDLSLAQYSVDQRMIHEIQAGIDAIHNSGDSDNNDDDDQSTPTTSMQTIRQIIQANEGGPYGSEVLPDIQKDSDHVWDNIINVKSSSKTNSTSVGQDWYKASIQINAHSTEPWTAQAIRLDGTLGTLFTFEKQQSK